MTEYCAVVLTMVAMAVVPHFAMLALAVVGLVLLWHLWPYLVLALAAVPVVLVGGAAACATLLAMAYGFSWLFATVLSPFDPVSPPIPYCALCYHG